MMKRRSLLKAIAAGSLTAAHPLACMLTKNVMAQTIMAGLDKPPIRTIFLYHPDGAEGDVFFPKAGSRILPSMTKPLQRVYDNLVFVDGIGFAGVAGTHEGGAFKCLSGYLDYGDRPGNRAPTSIDVLMGDADLENHATTGVSQSAVQIGVGTHEGHNDPRKISYKNGHPIGSPCDPRTSFQNLFGNASSAPSLEVKMLSAAKNDLNRIRSQIGTLDGQKERLDQHADAIAELERSLVGENLGGCASRPSDDIKNAPNPGSSDSNLWSAAGTLKVASKLQQMNAVAALSCGITKTISFSYGVPICWTTVPGLNSGDHDLSHHDPVGFIKSKSWWMEEVALFIERLASTPDIHGSLLDNTVIVAISELGSGSGHDHVRIPMFLASGRTGENNTGLLTGRSLNWRNSPYVKTERAGDGGPQTFVRHTHLLDAVRSAAGYSFKMPNTGDEATSSNIKSQLFDSSRFA